MNQQEKYQAFEALHQRSGTFVIPNPWNAGTAKMLESLWFEASATTSAGLAFSKRCLDSTTVMSRDETLDEARTIVAATGLPVSADLGNSFGDAPEICAETMKAACSVGLVGGSIEDFTEDRNDSIYAFDHAVERVSAAAEASRKLPIVLTARADNYLYGKPDLDDTIKRL